MKMIIFTKLFLVLTALFSSSSFSQTIHYELTQISATEYEYHYIVINDSLLPISEFVIYFDETLYDNLSEISQPADWDSIIIPPSSMLGDVGEYDAYVSGPELAVGESVSGFVVRFEWLGLDEPSVQPFEILDATTFASIYSGL